VDQIAEVELGLLVLRVQAHALLIGGVIEHQLVVLVAAVGLALEAGEQAVGVPLRGLVAVIDASGDQRANRIAFEEVDDDFLAAQSCRRPLRNHAASHAHSWQPAPAELQPASLAHALANHRPS
jgi:hypothetical protein